MCCHVLVQLFSVLQQEDIDEKMLAQKSSTRPKKFYWSNKVQLVQKRSTDPKKKFNWSKTYLEYLLALMAHELVFFAVCPQMNIERV